ncbi:MAG: glycosyltransferase [Clostridia bacterium]|nr:glycosyltransferase [Clostridia bacterium]
MPKVSIIVPVYNVEKYLEKCLDSLINQTLEDIEVIIVNDGSTDNSEKIIKKYMEANPNKFVYLTKENGGLSDARNFGIPYAKGEYIAFLDSDDYVEENMYKDMYELAIKDNSDMVECDFIWEYPNKQKIDVGEIYNGKHEMAQKVRVVAWNKLIKKEILEKAKIEFPKGYRYEDLEFTYKLIPYLEKVSFLKKPCVHYIQRSNSISNTQNERTKEIFDILDHIVSFYKEKGIYKEYETELEYTYARIILCSSLLRICKIKDKQVRKKLLYLTWNNLNNKFPNWKKNKILNQEKNKKNMYMKTVNKTTYKIYTKLFSI